MLWKVENISTSKTAWKTSLVEEEEEVFMRS